jgi:hypothetical protein
MVRQNRRCRHSLTGHRYSDGDRTGPSRRQLPGRHRHGKPVLNGGSPSINGCRWLRLRREAWNAVLSHRTLLERFSCQVDPQLQSCSMYAYLALQEHTFPSAFFALVWLRTLSPWVGVVCIRSLATQPSPTCRFERPFPPPCLRARAGSPPHTNSGLGLAQPRRYLPSKSPSRPVLIPPSKGAWPDVLPARCTACPGLARWLAERGPTVEAHDTGPRTPPPIQSSKLSWLQATAASRGSLFISSATLRASRCARHNRLSEEPCRCEPGSLLMKGRSLRSVSGITSDG